METVVAERAESYKIIIISKDGEKFDYLLKDLRRIPRLREIGKKRIGVNGELIYKVPIIAEIVRVIAAARLSPESLNAFGWNVLDRAIKQLDEFGGLRIVVEKILDVFIEDIMAENCVSVLRKMRKYKYETGEKKAFKFVLYNLCMGVANKTICLDFFRLIPSELVEFIGNDKLNSKGDGINVVRVIESWISVCSSRSTFRPLLYAYVRRVAINKDAYDEEYVKKHPIARSVIEHEALMNNLLPVRLERDVLLTIGGKTGPNLVIKRCDLYDKETETWKHVKEIDLPFSLMRHASVVLDGKLYVIGGYESDRSHNSQSAVYRLAEVGADRMRWEQRACLNNKRYGIENSTCVLNDSIYVIGGVDHTHDVTMMLRTVEKYDHKKNQWTTVRPMNTGRGHCAAAAAHGRIFVCGGMSQQTPILASVEMYLPDADVWVEVIPMNSPRRNHALLFDGQSLLVIGGFVSSDRVTATVEKWRPDGYQWTIHSELTVARACMGACFHDGRVYIIGGRLDRANKSTKSCEMYDPANNRWIEMGKLPAGRFGSSVVMMCDWYDGMKRGMEIRSTRSLTMATAYMPESISSDEDEVNMQYMVDGLNGSTNNNGD